MAQKQKITQEDRGWVIVCIDHPMTNKSFVVLNSFRYTRRQAIKDFNDSVVSWEYWKRKYNYRCVRATQTVVVS